MQKQWLHCKNEEKKAEKSRKLEIYLVTRVSYNEHKWKNTDFFSADKYISIADFFLSKKRLPQISEARKRETN